MAEYRVRWEIDIEAGSNEQAARVALAIQRDPESTATVFQVSPCESLWQVFEIDLEGATDEENI